MKNDYDFWGKYLAKIRNQLGKICKEKENLYIDLHMHSNYSADGKQNIKQILENTKSKGFDVIAITDHDSINVYDELYDYVKDGLTNPIIIPGIEFTCDNKEYGNQCHLLQLFINPKDNLLKQNVNKNYNAMFNRSKIQFKRLKENKAIQFLLKKYKFSISYSEYIKYLNKTDMIPEYDTLCFYLIDKFKLLKITTFEVLSLLERYNKEDIYDDRRKYKEKRYIKLRLKYEINEINKYNARFLLSMLAVREVDDDWWNIPSSGSLSVNSYGQLRVEELNDNYDVYFAHPSEKSIEVVERLIDLKKNIVGLEKNIRSECENYNYIYDLIKKKKLNLIVGSDTHDNTSSFYQDMEFYKMLSKDFIKIIECKK